MWSLENPSCRVKGSRATACASPFATRTECERPTKSFRSSATNQNRKRLAARAALGSQLVWLRIQRCFGRTIPFGGETKPGYWNGAATWAECSGGGVRSRGCLGASQSFGLRRQASWLKVWRGGGCKFKRRNEHTNGTEARLTRNAGCRVWSRSFTLAPAF